MSELRGRYEQLVALGIPDNMPHADAIHRISTLIDLASDLHKEDGLEIAIAWTSSLLANDVTDVHRAHLNYGAGNAWSALDQLRHEGSESTWEWERTEIEQEILHYRKATLLSKSSGIDAVRRCQCHTNLANSLSKIGRFVEAIEHWSIALSVDADFGMAIGNRGFGLLHYARALYDPGHCGVFLRVCIGDIEHALSLTLEPGVSEPLESALAEAIDAAERLQVAETINLDGYELGESTEEIAYRTWCLRNRLFVNPLNDLGDHSIAARDVLHLPSITLPVGEPPSLIGFFNQLKQEFVSARYLFHEGITSEGPHFSDRDVLQINTLDYPVYSLAVERIKGAFRAGYSILDKMAFFLNEYLGLGVPAHKTSIRTIWYARQRRECGLRSELIRRQNWPLRGLYWLSKDLAENREGFTDAMAPDAREIAVTRNHLEHKYLKILQGFASPAESEDLALGFSMDTLARSVNLHDFEDKTLRVLKLVRTGLIYLSLAVHAEERRRKEERGKDAIVPPMFTDVWEDEWKA